MNATLKNLLTVDEQIKLSEMKWLSVHDDLESPIALLMVNQINELFFIIEPSILQRMIKEQFAGGVITGMVMSILTDRAIEKELSIF